MKELLSNVQAVVEQAVTALEELETAIDKQDYRKIGAKLYLLQIALKKLENLATLEDKP
jgi:hypothetical protein